MYILFKDGKSKALTLSYDDGTVHDKRLIEIMDKYGLKGTFNINSGVYRTEKSTPSDRARLSLDEAKKLFINSGHEVAVHGYLHLHTARLNKSELLHEIIEDKKNIEREYGCIARGMAYPYGSYNDDVIQIASACGIEYARTTISTESFQLPEDWLKLNPTCHHDAPGLMKLAEKFVNYSASECALFYLWGHSHEFNSKNNWEVIENFASYVGGKDDIWYATNIEIFDYVAAYKSLKLSYDGEIVYNPSAYDVWFHSNGEKYLIKSGNILRLN